MVNENGNNSLPYPERLRECTGILAAQVQNEDEAESISALEGIHTIRPPRKTQKH